MFNELYNVFEEAMNHSSSTKLDGETYLARMYYGVKIVRDKDTHAITIYDTARGGDYYREMNEEQYNMFFEDGWKTGVRKLTLVKYKERLDVIEKKIKEEINGKNNPNYISYLKDTRSTTLNKYYNITQKLNKNVKSTKNNRGTRW